MDIQTPRQVEYHSPKKDDQKSCHDTYTPLPEQADNQKDPQNQFQPRKNDRRKVDEEIWKYLVIINCFGKGWRVNDLIDARVNKDDTKN